MPAARPSRRPPGRPLVDRPVRGSRTGRPVMALLDLLGRRWVLRLVWELREEVVGFRDLQARCDAMSPSVLNKRLDDLQQHRLVETDETGAYRLSAAGHDLLAALEPLYRFSGTWAKSLRPRR